MSPLADRTVNVQCAAQVQDPFAHLAEAEMARLIDRAELTGIEAAAVVMHRNDHAAGRIDH